MVLSWCRSQSPADPLAHSGFRSFTRARARSEIRAGESSTVTGAAYATAHPARTASDSPAAISCSKTGMVMGAPAELLAEELRDGLVDPAPVGHVQESRELLRLRMVDLHGLAVLGLGR